MERKPLTTDENYLDHFERSMFQNRNILNKTPNVPKSEHKTPAFDTSEWCRNNPDASILLGFLIIAIFCILAIIV